MIFVCVLIYNHCKVQILSEMHLKVKFFLSYVCIETRLITSASYKFVTSIVVQRASFVSLTLGSEIMKRGSEMDARK